MPARPAAVVCRILSVAVRSLNERASAYRGEAEGSRHGPLVPDRRRCADGIWISETGVQRTGATGRRTARGERAAVGGECGQPAELGSSVLTWRYCSGWSSAGRVLSRRAVSVMPPAGRVPGPARGGRAAPGARAEQRGRTRRAAGEDPAVLMGCAPPSRSEKWLWCRPRRRDLSGADGAVQQFDAGSRLQGAVHCASSAGQILPSLGSASGAFG